MCNYDVRYFIIYTNQSIGKEPDKTNYESRENSINKEKDSRGKGQSKYNESSFASIQAVVNKEYGLPEDYKPEDFSWYQMYHSHLVER